MAGNLIGGLTLVAAVILTGILVSTNNASSQTNLNASELRSDIIGAASQTPWAQNIDGAAKVLTNAGNIYQINSAGIIQRTKRPTAEMSHIYYPLAFDLGDPLANNWFTMRVGSMTNVYNVTPGGEFDYGFSWGINIPGTPYYNPNKPYLQDSYEGYYVTSEGSQQMERYINFAGNSTNTHARPWGWSFEFNNELGTTHVLHTWNINQFRMFSKLGLGIDFDHSGDHSINQTFHNNGILTFSTADYPHTNTTYIAGHGGHNLLSEYQFGMDGLGGAFGGGSNGVVIMPGASVAAYDLGLWFGTTNNYRGIMNNVALGKMGSATWEGTGTAPVFRAFDSGVFTENVRVITGSGSNAFSSKIWMDGSDIDLETGHYVYVGNTDNAIYHRFWMGDLNGQWDLGFGTDRNIIFKTGSTTGGNGTTRMTVTSAGVFADNFYASNSISAQNFVNHAGSNLVQMIQDLQARIVALEQAK